MHCRQPSLNVPYGTGQVRDRYGAGTGQVRGRYGTGTVEGNTTPSTALMTAKRDRYGAGTGQVRSTVIRHRLLP